MKNRTHVEAPHAPGTQEASQGGLSSSPFPTYSSAVYGAASSSLVGQSPLCASGEGVSFQGASGMHEGCGYWTVIAPGVPCFVAYLGQDRAEVSGNFVSLLSSDLLIQGSSAVNGCSDCGACPGDGTVCETECRLSLESPPVSRSQFPGGHATKQKAGVAPRHQAQEEAAKAPRGRRDHALCIARPGLSGAEGGESSPLRKTLSPSANGGETTLGGVPRAGQPDA